MAWQGRLCEGKKKKAKKWRKKRVQEKRKKERRKKKELESILLKECNVFVFPPASMPRPFSI